VDSNFSVIFLKGAYIRPFFGRSGRSGFPNPLHVRLVLGWLVVLDLLRPKAKGTHSKRHRRVKINSKREELRESTKGRGFVAQLP
jgi:hypothetical protein